MSKIAAAFNSTTKQTISTSDAGAKAGRLIWLDVTRLLCALLILGIHWLRACYKVQLFGAADPVSLVINYQGHNQGLGMLPHVLIVGRSHSLAAILTDAVGIFGGFGWEGVSALIIVSGFSLPLALRQPFLPIAKLAGWYRKRMLRILVPFYLVAVPFLLAYIVLLELVSRAHGAFAHGLDLKLHSLLQTPPLGVALSHLLLFDPFARQWQADFFAPAWWFIPAILLAYAGFPLLLRAVRSFGAVATLIAAACVTAFTYHLADLGILINEAWYYIVLQELFSFTLGVVTGIAWLDIRRRPEMERFFFRGWTLALALAAFVLGNLANWSPITRPVASMLYGPGLVLIIMFVAKRVENFRFTQRALRVDAYDLYLVHQPFAFPIALAMKMVLHSYAVFIGWFVFVAVASGAAIVLTRVAGFVVGRPKPVGPRRTTETASLARD